MKRFWVFIFDRYESNGGIDDFKGFFDSIEEAVKFIETHDTSFYRSNGQIVDSTNLKTLKKFSMDFDDSVPIRWDDEEDL